MRGRIGMMVGKSGDEFEPSWNATAAFARLIQASILALLVVSSVMIGGPAPGFAQSSQPEAKVDFNIPAQPLARALVAYGAASGLEVFYKSVLAERQHSAEVAGLLTPTVALQTLLRGTGYVAQTTGPGAFTIVPTPREAALAISAADAARRSYEPYFATIQAQISDGLCRSAGAALERAEILLQLWLAPSGVIARAEVVGDDGNPADDQTLAVAMRGLAVGVPPVGMPQPLNMVIFPPSKTSKGCPPVGGQRRAG
jgi:hypothetical protein